MDSAFLQAVDPLDPYFLMSTPFLYVSPQYLEMFPTVRTLAGESHCPSSLPLCLHYHPQPYLKKQNKQKKTSYQNFTTQLPSLNTSTLDPGSGPHWAFHSCLPRPLFPHLQIPGDTTSRYEQDRIPKLLPEGPLSFSPSPPPPLSATHWPAEALPARQSTAITLS